VHEAEHRSGQPVFWQVGAEGPGALTAPGGRGGRRGDRPAAGPGRPPRPAGAGARAVT
jgi:hypothetical protein